MKSLIFAFVAAFAIAPIAAPAAESHVWVQNTTGKAVWVTTFTRNCPFQGPNKEVPIACTDRHIVHEWCVHPASESKQGFHVALTVVHLLVTTQSNCGRPIIKDWTFQFPRNNGSQVITRQYKVTRRALNSAQLYDVQEIPK